MSTEHAEQNDTNETTTSADEGEELTPVYQMDQLWNKLIPLDDDHLAPAVHQLRTALGALYCALAPSEDELMNGTSDELAAVQETVADELAAIRHQLDMQLALAAVRSAARGLGEAAVEH